MGGGAGVLSGLGTHAPGLGFQNLRQHAMAPVQRAGGSQQRVVGPTAEGRTLQVELELSQERARVLYECLECLKRIRRKLQVPQRMIAMRHIQVAPAAAPGAPRSLEAPCKNEVSH